MKSRLYINVKRQIKRFTDYCLLEENKKTSLAVIAVVILLTGIQAGSYLTERKSYVYNEKGELVAFVRSDTDSIESIPLRVKASRKDESTEKNVVINVTGKDNNSSKEDLQEEETESLQSLITQIVDRLSDSNERILYLPLKDEGMKLSWNKQRSYSALLIPLIFPLSMAILHENRKSAEKKKRARLVGSVKHSLPRFCSLLMLMMGSGLVFEDAFQRIAVMYDKNRDNEFKGIIADIRKQCENTSDNTVEALARQSRELEIRELSRLSGIIESGQKKGTDMTHKLEMESELLWNERKNYATEKGRAAEVKMSFPLAVLLMVLIVVTAAPAMMEM